MAGITPTGYVPKSLREVDSDIATEQKSTISPLLDTSADQPTGQANGIFARQIALVWELEAAIYAAFDPENAEGAALDNIGALRGIPRNSATKSVVTLTLTLDAGVTVPAGYLSSTADPTNLWATRDAVTSTSAGDYDVTALAETTGPRVANSGTINVISTTVPGWTAVTNAQDASLGRDLESDVDYRARQDAALASAGSGTIAAIRAALSGIPEILFIDVIENVLDVIVDGIPPHSFEAVIYDGTPAAASNTEIAQTIWDVKGSGGRSAGLSAGTATDELGASQIINFTRSNPKNVWLEYDITVDPILYPVDGDDQLKALVIQETSLGGSEELTPGEDLIASRMAALAFGISGVTDVTALRLGFAASPVGTSNLEILRREIANLDTSQILVTST